MTGTTSRPTLPDSRGRFGDYGGRFVPETLMAALEELELEYKLARSDSAFIAELDDLLANYVGRPSPLYFASNLTRELGGAQIYIKREDIITPAHTRSITPSVRRSSPVGSAKSGSSLKQAPGSTVLRRQRYVRCLICRARFTWVRSI